MPSAETKSKRNFAVIKNKKRSEVEQEMISDAIELASDDSCGEVQSFLVIAMYEDGYNIRTHIDPKMTDRLFSAYSKEVLDEYIAEGSQDDIS